MGGCGCNASAIGYDQKQWDKSSQDRIASQRRLLIRVSHSGYRIFLSWKKQKHLPGPMRAATLKLAGRSRNARDWCLAMIVSSSNHFNRRWFSSPNLPLVPYNFRHHGPSINLTLTIQSHRWMIVLSSLHDADCPIHRTPCGAKDDNAGKRRRKCHAYARKTGANQANQ